MMNGNRNSIKIFFWPMTAGGCNFIGPIEAWEIEGNDEEKTDGNEQNKNIPKFGNFLILFLIMDGMKIVEN